MMQINDVGKYTETCEYEAKKIPIRFFKNWKNRNLKAKL
jgi:hypothetical protein